MRLYVPATTASLEEWYAAGAVAATALGEAFEAADETEEGEYAALMSAADASAALLGPSGGRRVVVVVEAAPSGPGPLGQWLAVHADTADRPADADPDEDLGWFGVQEIEDLVGASS